MHAARTLPRRSHPVSSKQHKAASGKGTCQQRRRGASRTHQGGPWRCCRLAPAPRLAASAERGGQINTSVAGRTVVAPGEGCGCARPHGRVGGGSYPEGRAPRVGRAEMQRGRAAAQDGRDKEGPGRPQRCCCQKRRGSRQRRRRTRPTTLATHTHVPDGRSACLRLIHAALMPMQSSASHRMGPCAVALWHWRTATKITSRDGIAAAWIDQAG